MPAATPGNPACNAAMTATALPEICPLGFVQHRGGGALGVEMVGGKSAATTVWAASPLKLLVPRSRGPSVWAYLSSFGGGLVAGDETSVNVRVEEGARCFLGTQASSKVYRNPGGLPCGHRVMASLGNESLLVAAPDPVQAFAGAFYKQQQAFHLTNRSSLVLVDWLCSGRAARGERWSFADYRSRNEVFVSGERVLFDSLLLNQEQGPLDSSFRMGRFNCVAMVFLTGPLVAVNASDWLAEIHACPVPRRAGFMCSASAHRSGTLVRMAGESVEFVAGEIHRHLKFLSNLLHDDPWARKW